MAEEEKRKGEISRREFLKDAGLVVGGAAIGSAVLLAACAPKEEPATATVTTTATATATTTATKTVETTKTVGGATVTATVTSPPVTKMATVTVTPPAAAAPTIKLTVNKYKYELQVEPEDTLRDVLRDKLGLLSIKDMCSGYGACGSCTVIVDHRPVLTCMMLAIECGGITIETAEGIADAKHPLIETYIMNHCMQCGYCTPGFLVTAKALLDHNPKPTEDDIRDILGGNICRCGTYPAHIKAVLEAATKP